MSVDFGLTPNTRTFELIADFHVKEAATKANASSGEADNEATSSSSASDSLRSTFDLLYRSQEVAKNSMSTASSSRSQLASAVPRSRVQPQRHVAMQSTQSRSSQAFTGPVYFLPQQQHQQHAYPTTAYRPQLNVVQHAAPAPSGPAQVSPYVSLHSLSAPMHDCTFRRTGSA